MNECERLELESIGLQLKKISLQIEQQNTAVSNIALFQQIPAFCTLEQACKFKGGSDVESIRRKIWQQPCCGTRAKRCNGRKVWPREEIIKWLAVTDDTLEAYAESLGVNISQWFKNGKTIYRGK